MIKNVLRDRWFLLAPLVLFVVPIASANSFNPGAEVPSSPLLGVPAPIQMVCRTGFGVNDDYVTTAKNTSVTFSPLANDIDTPQQNFGGITGGPSHGTAVVVGLDAIKYTPSTGYTGSDSFGYLYIGCLQCSGQGASAWCSEPEPDFATVYITVTN